MLVVGRTLPLLHSVRRDFIFGILLAHKSLFSDFRVPCRPPLLLPLWCDRPGVTVSGEVICSVRTFSLLGEKGEGALSVCSSYLRTFLRSSLPSSHAARRALRGLENTTPSLFSPSKLKVLYYDIPGGGLLTVTVGIGKVVLLCPAAHIVMLLGYLLPRTVIVCCVHDGRPPAALVR